MNKTCSHCEAGYSSTKTASKFCSLSCAALHKGKLQAAARAEAVEKKCSNCKRHLPVGGFAVKDASKALRASECKSCHTVYRAAYYENNKAAEIARTKRNSVDRRAALQAEKVRIACQRCGYNRCHAALHFHHRDPAEKDFTLARAIARGMSVARIRAEMQKCDVLCANCHAEEHAET